MYIDIALTPLEESILLTALCTLILLVLVLLFRPRLFTRGLAPVLSVLAGGGVGESRRRSRTMSRALSVGAGAVVPGDLVGGKGGSSSSTTLDDGHPLTCKRPPSIFAHLAHPLILIQQTHQTILQTHARWNSIVHSNPGEFGWGWVGVWPVPTWGMWTTWAPVVGWLGKSFEVEVRGYGGDDIAGERSGAGVDHAGAGDEDKQEHGHPPGLKERKGSVGLGIVGVDVITPLTSPGVDLKGRRSSDHDPLTTVGEGTGGSAAAVVDGGTMMGSVVVPAEIQSVVGPGPLVGGPEPGLATTTASPKSVFRFSEGYDMGSSPTPPLERSQSQAQAAGQSKEVVGLVPSTTAGPTTGNKMNWMSDPYAQGRMDGAGFKVDGHGDVERQNSGHGGGEDDHEIGKFGLSLSSSGVPMGGVIAGHTSMSGSTSMAGLELSPGTIEPSGLGSFKTSSAGFEVHDHGERLGRPYTRSSRTEVEQGVVSPRRMDEVLDDEEEEVVPSSGQLPPPPPLPPQQPQLIPFTPFPDRIERSRSRRTSRWLVSKGKRMLVFSYARLAGPVGLCGIVAVVGMVMWETGRCWSIIARVVWEASMSNGEEAVGDEDPEQGLVKRGMMGLGEMSAGSTAVGTTGPPSQEGLLRAIIPGLTVPLSHIFPIIGTLIACQVIHESGHVIAAAMDSITPTRLAFNLHLIIPAASVTFPKTVSDLGPTSRLRMAASGPWNNLLTWIVLTLIASTRLWTFVYHDYSDQGRVVLDINFRSALSGHIPVGSIVEYLDDTPLRGEPDNWSDYLWDDVFDETRGWCIDKKRYLASQKAPCPPTSPVQFTSLPSNATDASIQCLPPYPLLTSRTWSCPCSSPLKICVKPLASENILRIQWKDAGAGVGGLMSKSEEVESIVVLWSGDKREVWDSVKVSRWAGRGGLVGRWVIGWIELVFSYTAMLSLSLALLNLLPLPRLDGAHMVEAVLDRLYPTTSNARLPLSAEVAAGGIPGDQGEKGIVNTISTGTERLGSGTAIVTRRRNIERGIEFGVIGLTTLMLGGQVLVWLL